MALYLIIYAIGVFTGAYIASKPFRIKVNKNARKFSFWWVKFAEGEDKKKAKEEAKAK